MRRLRFAAVVPLAAVALQVTPAFACGGLVAPDGDVHLDQATTFVAWHGGVEHYVTSFAFSGSVTDVGWIVPLPAVPDNIEAAGKWTLQRLEREFNPPPPIAFEGAAQDHASSPVVEQVQVEALDITVLKGSGQTVIDWCTHNGFELPSETQDHLLQYAKGSPVFMAARYDNAAAAARGMHSGDGVPLLITMQTPQLWVPLEVLANDNDNVNADIFLLTDQQLQPADARPLFFLPPLSFGTSSSIDGAPGLTIAGSEPLAGQLLTDLSSDRNMSWMPSQGWVTYLRLRASSDSVTYDLGVGNDGLIRLATFGTSAARTVVARPAAPTAAAWVPGVIAAGGLLTVAAGAVLIRHRTRIARVASS
ncbi:MAG: DUF2330 domain-containing protein [Candidatus Dormibacteraeota bacterium]|nr:DUF2330 domain-containing protein [Candidatus Dormibacteraeota bacterium]